MKIVIAPDSFKGSLDALQVAKAIEEGISPVLTNASYLLFPMADGGEGTLEAFSYRKQLPIQHINAKNAYGIDKSVPILIDHTEAYIESASVVGITDFKREELNPIHSTTFGVGQLIKSALDQGCSKIVVGLGGSATNDGGAGLLEALGARFSHNGKPLSNIKLKDLDKVDHVDLSTLDPRVKDIELVIASDVNNPLTGVNGATSVFGPQKGVKPDDIPLIDGWINHFAMLVSPEAINTPGAGAAGGLGYALLAIGGRFEQGAKVIGESLQLPQAIQEADLIITGEGRTDHQTMFGKVPHYIAQEADKAGKPVILISGSLDHDASELENTFTAMFSVAHSPCTLDFAMTHASELTRSRAKEIAKLVKLSLPHK